MFAAEHAPGDPLRLLERRHGLAEIVERGGGVLAERLRVAANNYSLALVKVKRYQESRSVLRKIIPIARHAYGASDRITVTMRGIYAESLYKDPAATLDDLREAVNTLEESTRIMRRVLGRGHPLVVQLDSELQAARAALALRSE